MSRLLIVATCCLFALAPSSTRAQEPKVIISKKPRAVSRSPRPLSEPYSRPLPKSPSLLESGDRQAVWRVYYATDRQRVTDMKARSISYGVVPDSPSRLEYGDCQIVIPRQRPPATTAGNLASSAASSGVAAAIECREIRPLFVNRFWSELSETILQSPQRDVLVFVHGYRTTFEQGACRGGLLAVDLPFDGVVVCYSWPSVGAARNYGRDERQLEGTIRNLAKFLTALSNHLGSQARISVIAENMGSRALMQAVAMMPRNVRTSRPFQHIVLAAPDVGIDKFPTLAARCAEAARHMTLYASKVDEAMVAARTFHTVQRAGDASSPVIVPGVDTIDLSETSAPWLASVDASSNRLVLDELFQVLKLDKPPQQRPSLQASKHNGKTFWRFNDTPAEVRQAEASREPALKK